MTGTTAAAEANRGNGIVTERHGTINTGLAGQSTGPDESEPLENLSPHFSHDVGVTLSEAAWICTVTPGGICNGVARSRSVVRIVTPAGPAETSTRPGSGFHACGPGLHHDVAAHASSAATHTTRESTRHALMTRSLTRRPPFRILDVAGAPPADHIHSERSNPSPAAPAGGASYRLGVHLTELHWS